MQKLQLDVLFQIFGIGAASGLVYNNDALFIIADNSTFLYEYKIHEKELYNIKLSQNSQQNIVKKEKPDFESISIKDNKLYMFGSGSTNQRMKCFTYDLKSKKIVKKDISALYYKLKKIAAIGDEDFNIEGAYFYNKNWYLLQRGNGANAKNGIFIVARQNNKTKFVPVLLPKINQVATSFTDAIIFKNKIYFLATAEATLSTYNDGIVLGSLLGCIDLQTFQLEFSEEISKGQKFEGLTIYKNSNSQIEFLLCEDNDTSELQTIIYKLTLNLK